ncbi:hypothetical protein NBO_555g0004 [Nosema bombycis CQ1]|uniref:Uncharacterized protein n=1 Tax=Nosema bombycis (strain CQ1 / CVCC 102059) TaxID=578461 RepID=R0KPG7_NOSB1|nr:hypothetical protein NBO_555g0004 [Nosema bombycis CQ1]|eukprot:EOB12082.1 hypothetical protein NBO_555g0004 [Nosema bombycis CQ1]
MNLMFYVAVYISFISSLKNEKHDGKVAIQVDKNTLDLKFTEDDDYIVGKMKIKDHLPIEESVRWYSDNEFIFSTALRIDGVNSDLPTERLQKVDGDIKAKIDEEFGKITNINVEFKIEKNKFKYTEGPIELELVLAKIDDLKKFLVEIHDKAKSFDENNKEAVEKNRKWAEDKRESIPIYYVITFKNFSKGKLTNLDDYEIVAYKPKSNSEDFSIKSILLKSVKDVVINMLVTVGGFGCLIFAGRYSLSKYF